MSITAPEPQPTPPERPAAPRASRLRRVAITLSVLAVALGVLVLFAPAIAARTFLKDSIVAAAAGSIDGSLAVESLDLGWLAPVELRGVTLTGPDGKVVATVPMIRTAKTLLALARAGGDYGKVTVEKPVVTVVVDGDSSNLERALDKILNAPKQDKSTRAGLTLEVVDGEATLSHAQSPKVAHFTGLAATVAVPQSTAEPITAVGQFAAESGGGTFDVSAGETVTAAIHAAALPLESFAALVTRFGRGAEVKGRLSADLGATRAAGVLTFKGNAAIDGLDTVGPWSEGHHLVIQRVAADAKEVQFGNGMLKLTGATLDSEVGRVRATAEVSTVAPINELFSTPGLDVDLDLDVAKLVNAAPKLLRLKPGTSLTEGKLTASVESHQRAGRVVWAGTMNTTALKGTRGGKPIGWDKPMLFAGAGHLRDSDGLPVFEKLTWEADFIGLVAAGSVERFEIDARVDLDRLAVRLAEFVDLGGSSLGGQGSLAIKCEPGPDKTFRLGATAGATDFRYADATGREVREPKLTATLAANGKFAHKQPLRVDAATLTLVAGPDKLAANLLAPVPDLKVAVGGRAELALEGELARWHARLVEFVPSLAPYKFAGRGPVKATLDVTPTAYAITGGDADLADFRFDGAGVHLEEPKLTLKVGATYPRAGGSITLSDVNLHCDTAVVETPRADIQFSPAVVKTAAKVTANVNRVQKALRLDSTPVNGQAIGTVKLEPQQGPLVFDADLKVTDLMLGEPAKPTWREPWATVKAVGFYDGAKSELDLRTLELGRDGLALSGDAHLTDIAGAKRLESKGTLTYDLARLEPQLKSLLGQAASARGSSARPFRVAGPLNNLGELTAQAGLKWEQLRAYGFTVDAGEVTATAQNGQLVVSPIAAGFGGGVVRVEPTVDLGAPGMPMVLKSGKLIDKTKLTPEACASALGYALPAFANAARATGEVSFDLDENRVPLTDTKSAAARGVLTVHNADVSAGPMVEQILTALGAERTSLKLSREQRVPVEFKEGRVYHKDFGLTIGQAEVVSSGSVGVDQTVRVTLDMPVPPRLLSQALARNPRVREALAGKRIKVPVTGTLTNPVLDQRGMTSAVQELMRGAAGDAIRDGADQAKDKVREKLRGELDKLLPTGRRK